MTVQGLRCARGAVSGAELGADFLQGALGAGDAVHLGVGVVLQFQTLRLPGIMGRSFRVLLLEREECL